MSSRAFTSITRRVISWRSITTGYFRGVARGGAQWDKCTPPQQRMTKKFSPLFLKRLIKKLSIDWRDGASQLRCSQGRAPHDMVCPPAKNPSYAPVLTDRSLRHVWNCLRHKFYDPDYEHPIHQSPRHVVFVGRMTWRQNSKITIKIRNYIWFALGRIAQRLNNPGKAPKCWLSMQYNAIQYSFIAVAGRPLRKWHTQWHAR